MGSSTRSSLYKTLVTSLRDDWLLEDRASIALKICEALPRAIDEAKIPPWKPLASSSSGNDEGEMETESSNVVELKEDGTVAMTSHLYT